MVGGLWDDSAGTGDQHCQGRLAFPAKQKEQTLIRRPLGELHPAAGSQLPSTVSLAMDFFLSFPQDILQKNNQKKWRKTHMCWLPFHFLQLPLCMTQSSCFRQSHLPHIYVFPPFCIPAGAVFSRAIWSLSFILGGVCPFTCVYILSHSI